MRIITGVTSQAKFGFSEGIFQYFAKTPWILGMQRCPDASDYSVNFVEQKIHDCLQHVKYS